MGRIIVSTNTTVDGISQDPSGDEGFERGGWFLEISDQDRAAWAAAALAEARHMRAYLVGGRSYEWFAGRWVDRDGELAELFNAKPKYVVRSREGRSDWGPTTVLDGDLVTAVSELKGALDGDIAVYASYELVQALFESDLVDEVRVIVFPQVAGAGGRLFRDLTRKLPLRLSGVERIGDQLVRTSYEVATAASAAQG